MTDTIEPLRELRPPPSKGVLASFDLLDRIGVGLANFAGVAPVERSTPAPRLDAELLRVVGRRIAGDAHKLRVFLAYVGAVALFSAVVATLLVTGMLGAAYERIWTWYPGRPWTHVIRDHPWIYGVLAIALSVVPFLLAPRGRWGRAFLTYVIFLVGFLGGHVFW